MFLLTVALTTLTSTKMKSCFLIEYELNLPLKNVKQNPQRLTSPKSFTKSVQLNLVLINYLEFINI